jgi:hypothetical protein
MKIGHKGQGDVNSVGWIAVEIIILVIATVAFVKMVNAVWNPDKQITYSNVQNLASKMNEACLTGKTVTLSDFSMPQPKPSKMFGAIDILIKMALNLGGDPQYVLYYESFPPGEAIGWETYQNMNYRVVAPIDDNSITDLKRGLTLSDSYKFIIKVGKDATDKTKEIEASLPEDQRSEVVAPEVVIPNIILDNEQMSGKVMEEKPYNFPGTLGQWEFNNGNNEDYYQFNQYGTLGVLYKSLVKYRACGANSLCMKTREGVYKFPLNYCAGKIQMVQLMYKNTNNRGDKISDFYAASPCSFPADASKLDIEVTKCSCSKILKYPLYEYNSETKLLQVKKDENGNEIDHIECLDSIENDGAPDNTEEIPCIKITYQGGNNDFCWTDNNNIIIAGISGGKPVTTTTKYSDGKIILKPPSSLNSLLLKMGKSTWWGWPGASW